MDLVLKRNLAHQTIPIERLCSIFSNVGIQKPMKSIENPIIDLKSPYLYQNINRLQEGLPSNMQELSQDETDYLNVDIKMETGTGKTYVYTKAIYEMNKLYGFKKFIVAVPSLAIKAGTENFMKIQSNINHFKNVCGYKTEIKLRTVESIKTRKGSKKYVPNSIRDFVTSSNLQRNTIEVLLVNMQHLRESKSGVLVRDDYDSHIEGYYRPIDAISATRPILLIDEPHRFNRENATYKFIKEQVKPQMIIRFGATFPSKFIGRGRNRVEVKDYQNLIYDLNIHKAFDQNLIKGVAKEHVESPDSEEEVFKILTMKKGEFVRFQKTALNEQNQTVKTTKDLKLHDSLSLLSPKFSGITIDGILATKVNLSNGEEKFTGDVFFADVFATSYVRESIRLALKRHFETERENFKRKFKIKTLALFFIDDIHSYRDNDIKEPYLKNIFEEELRRKLEKEINNCDMFESKYREFLEESLANIKETHAGYFSQDNVSTEEEIEKEVNTILFDKERLLSLVDKNGKVNTTRFIFSKWTLKEGWDNPNIFTIAKLRSSGSDNSKLQEIGRGLRLPVDETGNRIENETFTLNYIVDFTEKNFVKKLEEEIYGETSFDQKELTPEQIEQIATNKGLSKEEVLIDLMSKGFISFDREIKTDKLQEFMNEYPEIFKKLDKNRVSDRNIDKNKKVAIRKENYLKLKDLWEKLNEKYYLHFDTIADDVLIGIVSYVITEDLITTTARRTKRETSEMVQGELIFNVTLDSIDSSDDDTLNYGTFLKAVAENTNISIPLIHAGMVRASKLKTIENAFFTKDTVRSFSIYFKQRIYDELLKIYSYKKLPNTTVHPTELTEENGNPRDFVKTSAYLGVNERKGTPLDNYLYDTILFDSEIEENNINENISSVEVYGKIPKRTMQIPFIDGSTYSPDFMYVIKDKEGKPTITLVVESKGVNKKQDLRGTEDHKIEAANKLFDMVKEVGANDEYGGQTKFEDLGDVLRGKGISVSYIRQTNNEKMLEIINDLIESE
ncbi:MULTISPECIES: type III restriction-modification system endonuclease [Bacillales]|uniref:type III restriction-modification system endonuclease n=1 Tax=Bacillales TaxID=1385 RepID=UPI001296CA09|nr:MULTISPECIES: type III restriction-modification system endonuclease [Bacillales]MEB7759009.1 type III restriction-modification system endonuclease [Staphylococcus equorum]MEB7761592.1 type III restriction-modification system endonuclease [Staphylococcus equorum]UTT56185.1 type III restriction-modification system endonuclease [Staphylococcus equorum]